MDPGCSSGVRSLDRLIEHTDQYEGIKPPTWAIRFVCLCNDCCFICSIILSLYSVVNHYFQ